MIANIIAGIVAYIFAGFTFKFWYYLYIIHLVFWISHEYVQMVTIHATSVTTTVASIHFWEVGLDMPALKYERDALLVLEEYLGISIFYFLLLLIPNFILWLYRGQYPIPGCSLAQLYRKFLLFPAFVHTVFAFVRIHQLRMRHNDEMELFLFPASACLIIVSFLSSMLLLSGFALVYTLPYRFDLKSALQQEDRAEAEHQNDMKMDEYQVRNLQSQLNEPRLQRRNRRRH